MQARTNRRAGALFSVLRLRQAILGAGMLALLVGLMACSTDQGGTGGSPAPTPRPQQCGAIHILGPAVNDPEAKQAENCFWLAFQHCQAASLNFTVAGTDAGVTRTFTVTKQGSACVVTDTRQNYVVPAYKSPIATYTCTGGVTQTPDGLLFQSCGKDGNVAVPGNGQ